MAITHKYVDFSGGSDLDDGDSDGDAYGTIQRAIDEIDGAAGNQINVKSNAAHVTPEGGNSYDLSGLSVSTSQNNPLIISGYTSTPGDGGIGEIDGADEIAKIFINAPSHFFLKDLKIHNCTSYMVSFSSFWGMFRCELRDVGPYGGSCWDPGSIGIVYGCHIHDIEQGGATHALRLGYYAYASNNYVHDVSGHGIWADGNMIVLTNNLVHTTGENGIDSASNEMHIINNNTVVGEDIAGKYGLDLNATDIVMAVGNIVKDWDIGINNDSGGIVLYHGYNHLHGNTPGEDYSGSVLHDLENNEVDNPDFTDVDGGDFSVGSSAKAKSYPTEFKGSSTNTFIDTGAAQREEEGGGGGGGTIRRHPKVLGGA